MKYSDMEAYTYSQLESLTHKELAGQTASYLAGRDYDKVYFFHRPFNYDDGVLITSPDDTIEGLLANTYDYDQNTFWKTDAATPSIVIDLTEATLIDSFWMKAENVKTYAIYHSANGVDWTAVVDAVQEYDGDKFYWMLGFTEQNKRYWKISISEKYASSDYVKVYEFMLLYKAIEITDYPEIIKINPSDRIGGSYKLSEGSMATYSGQKVYAEITIILQYLQQATRDAFYTLFSEHNKLAVFPDVMYGNQIYRVVWDTKFSVSEQTLYRGHGYGGNVRLVEY